MAILYLVRHGIAEEGRAGKDDVSRRLTAEGVQKFRAAAKGLAKIIGHDEVHILTSPLVRARQTAEILAKALHLTEIEVSEALAPPGDLKSLVAESRRLKTDVIAVGHEPTLGDWVGQLCFHRRGQVELKKGGAAAIELSPRETAGALLWLLPPKILRI